MRIKIKIIEEDKLYQFGRVVENFLNSIDEENIIDTSYNIAPSQHGNIIKMYSAIITYKINE